MSGTGDSGLLAGLGRGAGLVSLLGLVLIV